MFKKILVLVLALMMCIGLFAGCTDYGYEFHFAVDGGGGDITIENENWLHLVGSCSGEYLWCRLECAEDSHMIMRRGGKNGYHEVTFIAIPDEGRQVKEWLFNGKVIEGNKTNSYTAKVTSKQDYYGVISVKFEAI